MDEHNKIEVEKVWMEGKRIFAIPAPESIKAILSSQLDSLEAALPKKVGKLYIWIKNQKKEVPSDWYRGFNAALSEVREIIKGMKEKK